MEEEILDIKRENYRLRKGNFELLQDNVKLQEEKQALEHKLREKICMEAHSQYKELQENSVPKSKIKEKIKEIQGRELTVYLGGRSGGKTLKQIVNTEIIIVLHELLDDTKKEDN